MVDAGERADVILESVLAQSGYLDELEASDDPQDGTRFENLAELVAVAREFSDDPQAGPSADPADVDAGLVAPGPVRLPRAGGAGRRRRPDPRRRGRRRRRHADDAAHGQGARVPRRLPDRPRGRRVPALALARRPARARGGAPARVRRPHPRPAAPLRLAGPDAVRLGRSRAQPRLTVPRRAPGRPGRLESAPRPPRPLAAPRPDRRTGARPRRPSPPAVATSPRPPPGPTPPPRRSRPADPSLEPGDRVQHDTFGLGTVVALEGVGDRSVASIDFGSDGVKRLLLRYAPVEKL